MQLHKNKRQGLYGSLPLLCLSSVCVCLLLFYIDEGAYSFKGLLDPGNVIAMLLYLIGIFAGQSLLYYLLRKQFKVAISFTLATIIGSVIGIFLTIGILFPLAGLLNAFGVH